MNCLSKRMLSKGSQPALRVLGLALMLLLTTACGPSKAELRAQSDRHPVRAIAYWGQDWQRQPLAERVQSAPPALLEKIALENRLLELPERPVAAPADPVFSQALKRVEALLPEPLQRLAGERIIGIYLVSNLGTTGYTEAVHDGSGRETFAVIALDRELLLQKTANAWATWRERSFFRSWEPQKIELTVRVERDRDDTVENAIVLILLHEMGHALGMASNVHPSWNDTPEVGSRWPFTLLSWRMQETALESRYDDTFLQRKWLRPYAFEKAASYLPEAAGIYRQLEGTNYPTLYAATNPWEDFAETFAHYMHCVRQGKPYEIRIRDKGVPDAVFTPCWDDTRCRSKRAFLEKWLEHPLP